MARKKVGLALGSGAARGMAHIGVLAALEKEGIPVDMIAGTSAGAAIGALYAYGKSVHFIRKMALDFARMRLAPLADLTLSRSGLVRGRKVQDWFRSAIGPEVQFKDLRIPFACVASDISTGEELVMSDGPVVEAVRASISIPGIFTVARREGRFLVDGVLVNPVPVSVLKDMGAEVIIAVNILPHATPRDKSYWLHQEVAKAADKEPNIFHILMQSVYIGTHSLALSALKNADIIIEPEVAHIGPTEFNRARECIQQGEAAAREAMPRITRLLSA